MLAVLRIIGTFNAAIWIGSALFFTFGVAPGIFSDEMKQVFAPPGGPLGDYYLGFIAQKLIGRYFLVNLACALIALGHFFAEIIYAGKPFRRFQFGLIVLMLVLGLLGGNLFAPKIKTAHQLKYRGPVEQRDGAAKQLARLHGISMSGNLLSLLALVIYTWQVTNPPDHTRFLSAKKFRG
ncbi:MAG TPA: DUF4149 domain-containing protein [Methylomirabilota bacterium]|nr:DUF4149 domain-containing protein [Methylomirabilota bacterium]